MTSFSRHREVAMVRTACIAASLFLLAAEPPKSQPAQERVRGDVVSVGGSTITLRSRTGEMLTLRLADDARVSLAEKAELDEIHDGSFIGTTAVPQPDGTLRAIEVHVFPDSMRGTGEGHRPWDLQPNSTMTNATVASVGTATVANDRQLLLKYSGGEKTVDVPPEAAVVKLQPGDRSRIKPGVHLFAIVSRQEDGTLRADRVTIGEGGLVPPM
jgi:hypothetical protein